jgi:hypothetical protein
LSEEIGKEEGVDRGGGEGSDGREREEEGDGEVKGATKGREGEGEEERLDGEKESEEGESVLEKIARDPVTLTPSFDRLIE